MKSKSLDSTFNNNSTDASRTPTRETSVVVSQRNNNNNNTDNNNNNNNNTDETAITVQSALSPFNDSFAAIHNIIKLTTQTHASPEHFDKNIYTMFSNNLLASEDENVRKLKPLFDAHRISPAANVKPQECRLRIQRCMFFAKFMYRVLRDDGIEIVYGNECTDIIEERVVWESMGPWLGALDSKVSFQSFKVVALLSNMWTSITFPNQHQQIVDEIVKMADNTRHKSVSLSAMLNFRRTLTKGNNKTNSGKNIQPQHIDTCSFWYLMMKMCHTNCLP